MVFALSCQRLDLALVVVLALLRSADSKCSSDEIKCRIGGRCIYKYNICDGPSHCPDGSDEAPAMCKVWPPLSISCRDRRESQYYFEGCRNIYEVCRNSDWSSALDPRVCKIVLQDQLEPVQEGMSNEVAALLSSVVNSTLEQRKPNCPKLYTRVGKDCVSFFSPARVSWVEARHFCRSIFGDLWHFTDVATYADLLDFMREEQFSSDYWIGGRFDPDVNAWSWTADDSVMPLGAPYWALKEADRCVPRDGPHTISYSRWCYKAELCPRKRYAGWCAAMTYENYYYLSDELCKETFSPLCVFTGFIAPREADSN